MPDRFRVVASGSTFKVQDIETGEVKAKGTTLRKATNQAAILQGLHEHGDKAKGQKRLTTKTAPKAKPKAKAKAAVTNGKRRLRGKQHVEGVDID